MRTQPFLLRLLIAGLGLMLAGPLAAQTVKQVTGGGEHTLFVKSDGSLWGMGLNVYGELGLGQSIVGTNLPVEIVTNGVRMAAAGENHSLFIEGNQIWAMGYGYFGQLGNGGSGSYYVPEAVYTANGFDSFSTIAAGMDQSYFGFNVSIPSISKYSYSLWATGWNVTGQLGDGTENGSLSYEEVLSVNGSGDIPSIASGYLHALYVRNDGSLWGMGDNEYGQLGTGGVPAEASNQVMIVSSGVTTAAAGGYHSFFIETDGSLWGMGDNTDGELGTGTITDFYIPVKVIPSGVIAVATGVAHSICLKSDGTLWGTGFNGSGQLGDGTTNEHNSWFQIGPSNVVAVAAGYNNSLFIKSDGSLWGMGDNSDGQLGLDDNTNRYVPTEIIAPPAPVIAGISVTGANVVVTWPTNQGIFYLQTSSSVGPSAVWSAAPGAVVVNGQNTVTNPVSPSQQFFRLGE